MQCSLCDQYNAQPGSRRVAGDGEIEGDSEGPEGDGSGEGDREGDGGKPLGYQ